MPATKPILILLSLQRRFLELLAALPLPPLFWSWRAEATPSPWRSRYDGGGVMAGSAPAAPIRATSLGVPGCDSQTNGTAPGSAQ